jgi:hypothetical protein
MTSPITADHVAVRHRIRRGLRRRMPILTWLPLYKRAQLRPDIVAGVVVAALAIHSLSDTRPSQGCRYR